MQSPNGFSPSDATTGQLEVLSRVLTELASASSPGGRACRLLGDVNRELQDREREAQDLSEAAQCSREVRGLLEMHESLSRLDVEGRYGGLRDHIARTIRQARAEVRSAYSGSRR